MTLSKAKHHLTSSLTNLLALLGGSIGSTISTFLLKKKKKKEPNFNYFNAHLFKDICRSDCSQTSKYLQPVHVSSIPSTISLEAYFILRFWLSESLVHLTPITTTNNFIVYSSVEQKFTCKYDFWNNIHPDLKVKHIKARVSYVAMTRVKRTGHNSLTIPVAPYLNSA